MKKTKRKKLVRHEDFVVEVEVELQESDSSWSRYLSTEDAFKLDDAREALRAGDLKKASRFGRVFSLTPLTD